MKVHGPRPEARSPLEPGPGDPGDPGPGGILRAGLFSAPPLDPAPLGPVEGRLAEPPPCPVTPAARLGREPGPEGWRRGRGRARPAALPGRGRAARPVRGLARGSPAFLPTLLSAADRGRSPLRLEPRDLHRWLRTARHGRLLLLVVDGSGSMGGELLELGRALAHGLIRDAYLRRNRVAMVGFRGDRAALLFGPTTQHELVERALARLPVGGTTPLAAALELALETLGRARRRAPEGRATLVLLTDGRANVPRSARAGHGRVLDEVEALSRRLAGLRWVDRVLVDATEQGKDGRPARAIAAWLEARLLPLAGLRRSGRRAAPLLAALLQGTTTSRSCEPTSAPPSATRSTKTP